MSRRAFAFSFSRGIIFHEIDLVEIDLVETDLVETDLDSRFRGSRRRLCFSIIPLNKLIVALASFERSVIAPKFERSKERAR